MKQQVEREEVTEQLKADNQMEWVSQMTNIRNRATEMVNNDIIYNQQTNDGRDIYFSLPLFRIVENFKKNRYNEKNMVLNRHS